MMYEVKYDVKYDVIEAAREKLGITGVTMGNICGHTHGWYSGCRNSNARMNTEDILAIAKVLDLQASDFAELDTTANKNREERAKTMNHSNNLFIVDYDKLGHILNDRGLKWGDVSIMAGWSRNWLDENRRKNRPITEAKVRYLCYTLGIELEDIRYVEPEPVVEESIPERVPEMPVVDSASANALKAAINSIHGLTAVNNSEFQQWIKDAYLQLHKDNLKIVESQEESTKQLCRILTEVNNNLAKLRKMWEDGEENG